MYVLICWFNAFLTLTNNNNIQGTNMGGKKKYLIDNMA